jgi:hypothetical protein
MKQIVKYFVLITCITLCKLSANAQASASTPFFMMWYEYGDGTFNSASTTGSVAVDNFFNTSTPAYSASSTNRGIQRYVGAYRPPTKPNALPLAYRPTSGGSTGGYTTVPMPAAKRLNIITSTSDFIADDTVMFALQYDKAPAGGQIPTKLLFFYNSTRDAAWQSINNTLEEYPTPECSTAVNANIPQIRTHRNESSRLATSSEITSYASATYLNGVVFNLNTTPPLRNNIFVTMFTLENIATDDNQKFELVMLDKDNRIMRRETGNILNHVRHGSHDPNYEKVVPECVIFPTDANKLLDYKVHFQNTGPGPALDVITTTELPAGYTVADIPGYPNSVNCYIGGQPANINYDVTFSAVGDKMIINFHRKVNPTTGAFVSSLILNGTMGSPDPANDITTTGDFDFQLRLHSPLTGPANLSSYTSIIFDENPPVETNKAVVRVRRCCDCMDRDGGQPDNNGDNNNPPKPRKCKWKQRWLQWLLCEDC